MKRARYLTSNDHYNLHHKVRDPPPPPPPPKKRNGIREGVRVTVSKLVFPPNSPTVQFDTTPTQSPGNLIMGNVVSSTSIMTCNTTNLPLIFLSRSTIRKKCGRSSGSSHQQSTIRSTNSGLTSTRVKSGRKGGSS